MLLNSNQIPYHGESYNAALSMINNESVNFKNYDYFYGLTYNYNYDIKVIMNRIYMDFICFAFSRNALNMESDNIMIHNIGRLVEDFIKNSLPSKQKQNWSALLGILDLLSGRPKPGKFMI